MEFDAQQVRAAQPALYEAGEYFALSALLEPAARALVEAAAVRDGSLVLDAGAGDGNISALVAAVGGRPVADDLSTVQLQRARARIVGLPAVMGDVEHLPFADETFDAVLSNFAAAYAPDPERAIAEMFRVCRPGGSVGLTAWPPESLMGQMNAVVRAASPDPGRHPDQELQWGVEEVARARCAPYATEVSVVHDWLPWDAGRRAAAGERDFGFLYARQHFPGVDLSGERARIWGQFPVDETTFRADYLLLAATKG